MFNNGIGKTIKCMIAMIIRVLVLITGFTLSIINEYSPNDNMFTIAELRLSAITYKSTHCNTGMDVVLQGIYKMIICFHTI